MDDITLYWLWRRGQQPRQIATAYKLSFEDVRRKFVTFSQDFHDMQIADKAKG